MNSLLKAQRSKFEAREGFYIVEAMVALGLLVFGFLGFVGLLSNSLSLNRVATHAYIGNFLALEGIELVKNTVDANIMYLQNLGKDTCRWNSGFETAGTYEEDWKLLQAPSGECPGSVWQNTNASQPQKTLYMDSEGHYGYIATDTPTTFKRLIRITTLPASDGKEPYELKVNSIVTWITRGGAQFEVNAEDHFFNWQRR